jgi:hypothetical protein
MNNERFAELLPWYVNGTIGSAERAEVDSYLASHPTARNQLDWFESLQTRIHESVPAVPATIGMDKVMKRIKAESPVAAGGMTLAARLGAFFDSFAMRPALALGLLAVIVLQGGVIANMLGQVKEDQVEMRALRANAVEEGPLVKVNFAPDAKESDIRLLLVSVQGTLAGGPGQLGDYYVRVPAGKEKQAAEKLKGKAIVQAVELSPGIPPRD